MSRIIQVESYIQNDETITCQVKTNQYTDSEITINKSDFEEFLDRHDKLKYAGIYSLTLKEYLVNETNHDICDDLSDFIVCKVIDFDIIFSDIFNHIQKLAKC